jgi:hypothetical protein
MDYPDLLDSVRFNMQKVVPTCARGVDPSIRGWGRSRMSIALPQGRS